MEKGTERLKGFFVTKSFLCKIIFSIVLLYTLSLSLSINLSKFAIKNA